MAQLEKAETRVLEVDTRFLDGDLDRESHARLLAHYRNSGPPRKGRCPTWKLLWRSSYSTSGTRRQC